MNEEKLTKADLFILLGTLSCIVEMFSLILMAIGSIWDFPSIFLKVTATVGLVSLVLGVISIFLWGYIESTTEAKR
ncbi:hypothetical protein RyT2_07860 [Pseudolactococcus yaeyamensis]